MHRRALRTLDFPNRSHDPLWRTWTTRRGRYRGKRWHRQGDRGPASLRGREGSLDIDAKPWAGLSRSIVAPGSINFLEVDVSQKSAVNRAFDAVASHDGRIDYLICCAAVFRHRAFLGPTFY